MFNPGQFIRVNYTDVGKVTAMFIEYVDDGDSAVVFIPGQEGTDTVEVSMICEPGPSLEVPSY